MASAAERGRDGRRVERVGATANDDEHALVHLDEQHECAGVRQVDDLVREMRDAVDVLGPLQRGDEDFLPVRRDGSSRSSRCASSSRSAQRAVCAGTR